MLSRRKKIIRISAVLWIFLAGSAFPWGFHAHKMIAAKAIAILPAEMITFFKRNAGRIIDASIQPDIRRYINESEGPRHYIDLELFENDSTGVRMDPEKLLQLRWKEVIGIYGISELNDRGILPWAIVDTYYKLIEAFKERDSERIVRYAADLCHYISDAHVPLHTTYNYNGQYTGQNGIHRLWESHIPEESSEKYTFWTGNAEYQEDIYSLIRDTILESNKMVDSVLAIEHRLSEITRQDLKYSFETRGTREVRQYAPEYIRVYEDSLHGMVERRMQASVKMTADLWYTCWIEGGQPDLSGLKKSKKLQIREQRTVADSTENLRRAHLHFK